MKQTFACLGCIGILASAPPPAGAQANTGAQTTTGAQTPAGAQAPAGTRSTREATLKEVTVRGAVQSVDHKARTVTVQGEDGKAVTLDVPASATRFDQVKVGDTVSMTYYDRVSVRPKTPDEPAVNKTIDPTTTSTAGALPGASRVRQRVATMTLTALDPATRSVTFSGPTGNTYTRYVVDTVDPAVFASLKSGDRVDVTWSEALTLQVTGAAPGAAAPAAQAAAPAAPPDSDDLRDRLTVSVQFGVDNGFSGKMIKAATGATTGGAPINLNDTTFDDVYGRIGMLKIGAGYRLSPRTEAVLNWVWSESDAQTGSINLGTAGANGEVPLNVNFSSYKYWGLEGGSRVYFARTRFTPYVGYLIGLNRHQDIRGTFTGVDTALTPGLAAQDGKFFEKSWALTLGPTGGMLVGVGPIEVMGEFQLRFAGGLSDVDWLVEEGLKDINDDSSRWSLPFVLGARLRF